jgi:hypothetical protein
MRGVARLNEIYARAGETRTGISGKLVRVFSIADGVGTMDCFASAHDDVDGWALTRIGRWLENFIDQIIADPEAGA